VHRIANGVDTVEFAPPTANERAALKGRLGLPPGPIVIYTGRLVSYKGVPLLLEAWHGLVAQEVPGTLVVVGEGGGDMHNCEPALREYTRRHGLGDRVIFAGAVLNVSDWLRAADVFAFPTENEAFGLSLVEAMACALPAVTTVVGGLGDFVQDRVNALVIAPGDAEGLARSLRGLLSDPALAARLGAAARERVLARFGQESVAAAYEALLAGLLQERTVGARA
jgi:glycosyltransferase involved in cell wall biosynthesis